MILYQITLFIDVTVHMEFIYYHLFVFTRINTYIRYLFILPKHLPNCLISIHAESYTYSVYSLFQIFSKEI